MATLAIKEATSAPNILLGASPDTQYEITDIVFYNTDAGAATEVTVSINDEIVLLSHAVPAKGSSFVNFSSSFSLDNDDNLTVVSAGLTVNVFVLGTAIQRR